MNSLGDAGVVIKESFYGGTGHERNTKPKKDPS